MNCNLTSKVSCLIKNTYNVLVRCQVLSALMSKDDQSKRGFLFGISWFITGSSGLVLKIPNNFQSKSLSFLASFSQSSSKRLGIESHRSLSNISFLMQHFSELQKTEVAIGGEIPLKSPIHLENTSALEKESRFIEAITMARFSNPWALDNAPQAAELYPYCQDLGHAQLNKIRGETSNSFQRRATFGRKTYSLDFLSIIVGFS
ncbi:hypothetical protein FGO68_gene11176 [Halteria grandinella]|uniref:Uncharacterized protein n=1 Tax=Halteria grandinella TaxID=5974 RepID=A0A8J8NG16_HALGN|nr:hypothetical protein FGO68_gene11176 [Halteria grandinella]